VITSIGNRYDKTQVSYEPEFTTNYDEVDDEIPLALSKQALKTIQASEIVKQEILENNKQTATRLANSFIGRMMRRGNDVLGDAIDDDPTIPSKKCHSSIFRKKLSKDDVAVASSQSFTVDPLKVLQRIQSKFSSKQKLNTKVRPSMSDEDFEEGRFELTF